MKGWIFIIGWCSIALSGLIIVFQFSIFSMTPRSDSVNEISFSTYFIINFINIAVLFVGNRVVFRSVFGVGALIFSSLVGAAVPLFCSSEEGLHAHSLGLVLPALFYGSGVCFLYLYRRGSC